MGLYVASASEIGTKQFSPPERARATVAVRRIQTPKLARAKKVGWSFGSASGTAVRDRNGTLSIPGLEIERVMKVLKLYPAE